MGTWSPFVRPETVRLSLEGLPGQQWIEVKKRLTKGEQNKITGGYLGTYAPDGARVLDQEALGLHAIHQYVTEWSFRTEDDKPIKVSLDALKNMDPGVVAVLDAAVEAHIARVEQEIAEAKKAHGEAVSSATSPSPA